MPSSSPREATAQTERSRRPDPAIQREGLPGTAFRWMYDQRMQQIADMPAAEAIARGLAFRCPSCTVLHPGIRYTQEKRRPFCSRACWGLGKVEEWAGRPAVGGLRMETRGLLRGLYGESV